MIATLYGGHVNPAPGPLKFVPLLRTGKNGGTATYDDVRSLGPREELDVEPTGLDYVLGARVSGKLGNDSNVNVIFLPDADLMSDLFFRFRQEGHQDFDFDNVTFLLNCVDALTRDESYIAVRKRQPKHRILTRFEERTREHTRKQIEETAAAKKGAKDKLKEARERLSAKVKEIEARKDLDEQTKIIMVANVQEVEQKRFESEQRRIDDEKKAAVERSQATMEQAIRKLQQDRSLISVIVTPLPALFIGLLVFVFRLAGEKGPA
jgi:ABC-2 type transport system permease protein